MCRERDVERQLGDADLLTSVQPPTENDGVGTKPPKGLSVKLGATNPDKEQERVKELEKREDFVRPVLGPRKTTAQSPRLVPYFPKSTMTSPQQPKSAPRNPSPAARTVARNPSPGPASRAAAAAGASATTTLTPTGVIATVAPRRNASPAPAIRATARNPLAPGPASRATARNPSPTPASKATARNPSPGPASRATARNPSPTPASKATARNPSPTPGISRIAARNPSPASKATARSSSPATGIRTSGVSSSSAAAAVVKPSFTRSNTGLASGDRRAASPSLARREMRSAPGTNRTGIVDGVKKSMPSVLFPSSKSSQPSVMSTSFSSDGSFSKDECPLESPISVKRLSTSALEDLQALRNLKMSTSSSDGSCSTMSTKGELASSQCSSPVISTKQLTVLDFDALRKHRESCSSSDGSSSKEEGFLEAESPTISGKKLSAMEVQSLKKHRLLNSFGKRAGPPKAGRVACEGMLPTSPVGVVMVATDTKKRCHWTTPQSEPILIAYHDEEWGVPVHNDKMLFELLVLEGAQSELSRPQILGLRDYFRDVFAGFDPEIVAQFDERKIAVLAADDVIRQTEAKVRGVVENAKQVVKIAQEFGSFNKYLWMFVGFKPIVNLARLFTQVPVKSSKSEALSRDLMRRGFRYVGPTTIYSFMQAAGMVNDHLTGCFRHSQCNSAPQQTTSSSSSSSTATATAVAESSEKRVYY